MDTRRQCTASREKHQYFQYFLLIGISVSNCSCV